MAENEKPPAQMTPEAETITDDKLVSLRHNPLKDISVLACL